MRHRRALGLRRPDVQLEVPVSVRYGSFEKRYFPDALVAAADRIAFQLTTFTSQAAAQNIIPHARRLLVHTKLDVLLWANPARHEITFRSLKA